MTDSAAERPTELDFDAIYRGVGPFRAPWDIGAPQPAYVAVEQAGGITGTVLDAGCGTGENALYLADQDYSVIGLDLSLTAVELARGKAAERGLAATFEVADALDLDAYTGRFDTVVDSGLAHLFDEDALRRYAAALHRACRPNAVVYLLALSGPGLETIAAQLRELSADEEHRLPPNLMPPSKSPDDLRAGFADGWQVEAIDESTLRAVLPSSNEPISISGWLARFRRV
ncbi:class I SAM-dependent methyltransferase [Nocardia sp. NEAU-G5]|uniref:Class I SAM-dependent methyltransferase n=2 Tax=Nocardia albiluteola TaxID=2842303 RepID=A0ABS6B5U7_9NOCA|nr:class I SAM-dependent methyltransferase [Nocardia albiluteola]